MEYVGLQPARHLGVMGVAMGVLRMLPGIWVGMGFVEIPGTVISTTPTYQKC